MVACERRWTGRLALEVATLMGAGRLPKAPGTWGTAVTMPFCWWAQQGGVGVQVGVLLLVLGVGTWATAVACRFYGRSDPPQVVVDEAAGVMVAMLAAPEGWFWLLVGFVLFRLFDIWKPWPVNWLDRKVPSPWGVMVDDLAAGVYAGVCIMVLARISMP
ncbi:MAG: phosphatidylglycerophosphatase A [Magnetococcus sp. MYC-9]